MIKNIFFGLMALSISAQASLVRDRGGKVVTNFSNECWQSRTEFDAAKVNCLKPAAKAAVAPAPAAKIESVAANFAFDESVLESQEQAKVKNVIEKLKKSDKVVIRGYADELGSEEYNTELSQRRALSLKNFLLENGIDSSRVEVSGQGISRKEMCDSLKRFKDKVDCLATERRAEIIFQDKSSL